jgi:hypothetical protein
MFAGDRKGLIVGKQKARLNRRDLEHSGYRNLSSHLQGREAPYLLAVKPQKHLPKSLSVVCHAESITLLPVSPSERPLRDDSPLTEKQPHVSGPKSF